VRLRARRAPQPPACNHHRHARPLDEIGLGAAEQNALELTDPDEQRGADEIDDVEQLMPRVLHVPGLVGEGYV
jgi:hypothetical protein